MIEFSSIESAIEDIKLGKMVVVMDDEDRENEGDLIMAGEKITPDAINFMATYGRGLICAPVSKEYADKFGLDLMVKSNNSQNETAFTVSIDIDNGGTGISCDDRSLTIEALTKDDTTAASFARPGHIFPLISKDGGVLVRDGHTEAATDLSVMAGFKPVGVICEILRDNGEMARGEHLTQFAKEHGLKLITIKDLIEYRKKNECGITAGDVIDFPNKYGDFKMQVFESNISDEYHVAIFKGDISNGGPVLTRLHSECFTGDLFGSGRCDCGDQLGNAMRMIEREGRGVVLYLRQEGRGIGLPNKIRAYKLQDQGLDTVDANLELGFEADMRDYSFAAQMYKQLGIEDIKLITNNPEKIEGLQKYGINTTERVESEICTTERNLDYMLTKRDRMRHMLPESLQ